MLYPHTMLPRYLYIFGFTLFSSSFAVSSHPLPAFSPLYFLNQINTSKQAEASPCFNEISLAIRQAQRVAITYQGGTTPGERRTVRPLRWFKDKIACRKFTALCERDAVEKDYFTALVTSLEVMYPELPIISFFFLFPFFFFFLILISFDVKYI